MKKYQVKINDRVVMEHELEEFCTWLAGELQAEGHNAHVESWVELPKRDGYEYWITTASSTIT